MKKIHAFLLFVCLRTFMLAQVNLSQGLGGCYALNGNGAEPVNNLTGTVSAAITPTVDRFNNAASAMFFPGTQGQVIALPNSPFIKPANAVSVSGWFKAATLAYMDIVFAKNIWTSFFTSYSLIIENTNGGYRFSVYRQNGSSGNVVTSTITVQQNTWYHVVFSISQNTMVLYINGSLQASVVPTITNFNFATNRGVILGGTNESNFDYPFVGSIDNVRIYDRVINAAEVQALYQQDPSCSALPPVASYTSNTSVICSGDSVAFTDQSLNGPTSWTYAVSGLSPTTYTNQSPVITFPAPGTFTINLTCANASGNSSFSNTIQVLPSPVVSVSASSPSICANSTLVLVASGNASSYMWNNGWTQPSTTVSPSQSTSYSVIAISPSGCTAMATIAVIVQPRPALAITYTNVCQGGNVVFMASGANTYTWSNMSLGPSLSLTAMAFTLGLSGSNTVGCAAQATLNYVPLALPNLTVTPAVNTVCVKQKVSLTASGAATYSWSPGAQTGSTFTLIPAVTTTVSVVGTGSNGCTNVLNRVITITDCVGLEDETNEKIQVYPNPFAGRFVITGLKPGAAIRIYSLNGSLILNSATDASQAEIKMAAFSDGLYILEIETQHETQYIKLVKY